MSKKNYIHTIKREKLTKLELNTTYIDNIMNKYILPRNKDVTYELYGAVRTNSIYLKLFYGRAVGWIRFSDHESKYKIETLSNAEQEITLAQVITTIQNRINKLHYKSKMIAFECIENQNKKEI